jgi:NADH-quinone oxidoreductase subunit N
VIEKLALVWPEIILFITTCVVMLTGQWPSAWLRRMTPWLAAVGLIGSIGAAMSTPPAGGLFPDLVPYAKALAAIMGLMLLPLMAGTVDRDLEAASAKGARFEPIRSNGGEFYAFFLFSITGLMLVASADSLIWLFLALELTSLPTYIMVTISTRTTRSQEAGVKYFFLGALGAAIFLYGFALIYGATGTTNIPAIAAHFAESGLGPIGTLGVMIALIGMSFKIAAVPMHYYTPDVYQGAASPVSAMLAFVPKAAGFLAIFLVAGAAGWGPDGGALPMPVEALLWVMAALTMTVGNVLALLQTSVKRMMAYSSIAHSGYMLVGVIAGPGPDGASFWRNGLAAVLFYLLCYGVMNLGVFAVLASLERKGEEADEIDDIRGLVKTHPPLGWSLVICSLSLLGFPPLLGFIGKVGLFTSGVASGNIALVVILGLNSAIAALYYLRLVAAAYLEPASDTGFRLSPYAGRQFAAILSAGGVLTLLLVGNRLIEAADGAARMRHGPDAHHADHPTDPAGHHTHDHADGHADH